MRPGYNWRLRSRTLPLGARTLVMGVVNVTPDSFSDAGLHLDPARAVEHALRLLEEGADIIDIGGESTRPGSQIQAEPNAHPDKRPESGSPRRKPLPVTASEEQRRILPVIEALHSIRPDAMISVDTYKAAVAQAAVEAGAEIVNDVSALTWDPEMAATVAALDCGAVLMHTRGRPHEWRNLPPVADIVALVSQELAGAALTAITSGVAREHIVLDPGFGFGKNYEENYPLLAHFEQLHRLGFPLLAGVSRKSFIGRAVARDAAPPAPEQRVHGSVAAMLIAIMKGAHIVRAHDVRPSVEAAALADAILQS